MKDFKEESIKHRKGYVSNSSSSSFVICKKLMTDEQVNCYRKFAEKYDDDENRGDYGCCPEEDNYYFSYTGDHGAGSYLYEKLINLGVDENKICDLED